MLPTSNTNSSTPAAKAASAASMAASTLAWASCVSQVSGLRPVNKMIVPPPSPMSCSAAPSMALATGLSSEGNCPEYSKSMVSPLASSTGVWVSAGHSTAPG